MNTIGEQFTAAFNILSALAHSNARAKGFRDDSDRLEQLANLNGLGIAMKKMRNSQLRDLMVSELGEACEGERKDLQSEKIPGFTNTEEEYADLVIRLMDMAHARKLGVAEAVVAKMEYNAGREHRHGG